MMEPALFLSYKKSNDIKSKHKKNNIVILWLIFLFVMFGLDPDISLMDPRNTLRLSEDDRRKIILSCSGLTRTSPLWIPRSSRGMTGKRKSTGMTISFFHSVWTLFLFCHCRAWPGNPITGAFIVFSHLFLLSRTRAPEK